MDKRLSLEDYLTSKEAGEKLGMTNKSIQRHIKNGEITAIKRGGRYFIHREDVENFRPRVAGRPRASVPQWRFSPPDNRLIATSIEANLKEGIGEADFIRALDRIKQSEKHLFQGTIARYIFSNKRTPNHVQFFFVWRQSAMPSPSEVEAMLENLRIALSSVLDWNGAEYNTNQMWMHT